MHQKVVTNRFFDTYYRHRHQFSDSYKYNIILSFFLRDNFRLTAAYLTHYSPADELHVGYDPGHFSSLIVSQKKLYGKELDIIKEFFAYYPQEQTDLARQFHDFFGDAAVNKTVHLWPDRAGNKRREELQQLLTDSRAMKLALENYGFSVILHNEGQATIYHWQQYKLCHILFAERIPGLPRVRIDENECPNLCSAIMISPIIRKGNTIELDKSSEKKQPLKRQAGLTTQLPSAMIYLLYGMYSDIISSQITSLPDDLPDNISL